MLKQVFIIGIGMLLLNGCHVGVNNSLDSTSSNSQSQSIKIQNGIPVDAPEINGMVPLIMIGNSAICTGTISRDTILTAAHCALDMTKKKSGGHYTQTNQIPPLQLKVIFNHNLNNPVNIHDLTQQLDIYSVSHVYVHNDAFLGVTVLGWIFKNYPVGG